MKMKDAGTESWAILTSRVQREEIVEETGEEQPMRQEYIQESHPESQKPCKVFIREKGHAADAWTPERPSEIVSRKVSVDVSMWLLLSNRTGTEVM